MYENFLPQYWEQNSTQLMCSLKSYIPGRGAEVEWNSTVHSEML